MKKRTIYTIDWVKRHPYKNATEEDRYFADLAEDVFKIISKSDLSSIFDDDKEVLADVAIRLTMWFEDLVSETGIWQAATKEFKKRYGSWLPFYKLGKDYEVGFVNKEDVMFLVWNEVQAYVGNDRFINPENPAIEWVSEDVFALFDEVWETAPANERLYDFLYDSTVTESYWKTRTVLGWFWLNSYVYPSAESDMMKTLDESVKNDDDERMVDMRLYFVAAQDSFCSKHNMLSITPQQWLGRIRNQKERKIWKNVKWRHISMLRFDEENDTQIIFRDLIYEEDIVVEKESFDEKYLRNDLRKDDVVYCSLVSFKGSWYQCGQLLPLSMSDKLRNFIDEQQRILKNIDYQSTLYPKFMEVSKGKDALFFGTLEELKDAYKKMGFKGVDEHVVLDFDNNCMMMCSPINGIVIVRDVAACVCADNNPFYDQTYASKNAHEFYFNSELVNYREACVLHDKNMLPDARVSSLKGDEYGQWFLHKHGAYIIDYFFSCTREYDYDAKLDLIQFRPIG